MIEATALVIGYIVIIVVLFGFVAFLGVLVKQSFPAYGLVKEMIAWAKEDTVDHELHWKKVGWFKKLRHIVSTTWNFTWDYPNEITMTLKDGRTKTIVAK